MKIQDAYNPRRSILVIETDTGIKINFNSGFGESDNIDAEITDSGTIAYFIGTNSGLHYASLLVVDINNLEYLEHVKGTDYICANVFIEGEELPEDFFDWETHKQINYLSEYL